MALWKFAIEGGFEPLQLNWNSGATGNYLADVAAGVYELTVTDDLGCTASIEARVEMESAPQLLEVVTSPAHCEEITGTAQIVLEEENGDYQYHWHFPNGDILNSDEATLTLPYGQFNVEVEDEHGCISNALFEIETLFPNRNRCR